MAVHDAPSGSSADRVMMVGRSNEPAPVWRSGVGMADRVGAAVLSSIVVGFFAALVTVVYGLLVWFTVAVAEDTCRLDAVDPARLGDRLDDCVDGTGVVLGGLTLLWVVALVWFWWWLVPGRMASKGSTIGMSMSGLRIRMAGEEALHLTRGRAVVRSVSALVGLVVLPVLVSVIAVVGLGSVGVLLGVVCALAVPPLWVLASWAHMSADPLRRSLSDRLAGSGMWGPGGSTEVWSAVSLAGAFLGLVPVAVVAGHLGLGNVRASHGVRQGRGAAKAGLTVGYLGLLWCAAMVALVVLGGVGWRNVATPGRCQMEVVRLARAATEFEERTGRYPRSDAELVFAGLVDAESDWYEVVDRNGTEFQLAVEDPSCRVGGGPED